MLTKFTLSAAVALTALTAMPAAAEAQSRYGYYDTRGNQYRQYDRRYDQRYAQRYNNQRYYNQRYYNQRRYNSRYGNHYGQRCSSGSTGTIIGAIAGGLLGREIAGRGDRTVGTIIGGAAGALAGRAIDRGDCRRR